MPPTGTGLIPVILVNFSDREVAGLTLTIAPAQVSENGGVTAAVGTVTRNTSTDVELAVALSSSDSSAVTVPATVTIPVGAAAATFPIAAVNDVALDGSQVATIIAGAANRLPSSADITVTDDDVPSLFLSLDQSTLSEGARAQRQWRRFRFI